MVVLAQRDPKWKDIPLGFGTGTLGQYGCVITSIAMCLNEKGYSYTPAQINDATKNVGGFVGSPANLYVWSSLEKVLPGKVKWIGTESYTSTPAPLTKLKSYLDSGHSVILEMSARPIGGREYHFVKAARVEGNDVIIHDPWYAEEAPVTKRFKEGSIDTAAEIITGFRVYKIEPNSASTTPPPANTQCEIQLAQERQWKQDLWEEKEEKVVIIKQKDEEIAKRDQTIKELTESVSGYKEQLTKVQEESKTRKGMYDKLIEYLSTKLGCAADEAVIRGEIDNLVDIETEVDKTKKAMEELEKKNEAAKKEIQAEVDAIRADLIKLVQSHADSVKDVATRLDKTQEKLGVVQKDEKAASKLAKLLEGIKKLLHLP